jgi:hypothetical protein
MTEGITLYEKILSENEDKGTQVRLVVSDFKGEQYVHLRKYYLSYEGDFVPSKEGVHFPATIQSIFALLDGVIEISSKEEANSSILKYFSEKLECLKSTNT